MDTSDHLLRFGSDFTPGEAMNETKDADIQVIVNIATKDGELIEQIIIEPYDLERWTIPHESIEDAISRALNIQKAR